MSPVGDVLAGFHSVWFLRDENLFGSTLNDHPTPASPNQITATRNAELALIDLIDKDLSDQLGILVNDYGDCTRLRNKPVRKRLIRNLVAKRFSKRGQLTDLAFLKLAFVKGYFWLTGHPNFPPSFASQHSQSATKFRRCQILRISAIDQISTAMASAVRVC